MALGLSVTGCRNQAKEDLKAFKKAEASFTNAKRLVAEGKLPEADDAFRDADAQLAEMRRRTGSGGLDDVELPEGRAVAGFTPREWQERWRRQFGETLTDEFDRLQARAKEGWIDRQVARVFYKTYEPSLAERWGGFVDRAAAWSGPKAYYYECVASEEDTCGALHEAIAARIAVPVLTDRLPSQDARAAAFGIIEVHSWARSWAGPELMASAKDPKAAEGVFSLPSRLEITLKVSTRAGRSSWDGEKRLEVGVEPSAEVAAMDHGAGFRRQLVLLREKMAREIAELPKQTLEL